MLRRVSASPSTGMIMSVRESLRRAVATFYTARILLLCDEGDVHLVMREHKRCYKA